MALMRIPRKPPTTLRLVSKQVWYQHWALVAHCFSHQPWILRVSLSPGSELPSTLHFEALQVLFRIYFKVSSFPVKALFCMRVFIWHFGMILKSDCSSWNWLAFGPFLLEQELFLLELASLWPISSGTGDVSLELCRFSLWPNSISNRGCSIGTVLSSFWPGSSGTRLFP